MFGIPQCHALYTQYWLTRIRNVMQKLVVEKSNQLFSNSKLFTFLGLHYSKTVSGYLYDQIRVC